VQAVEHFGLEGPVDEWRRLRDAIHADVCARAWDERLGAFTQAYGNGRLDASLLLMPLVGFLPADDPRVVGTVAAIERDLVDDAGFVLRYHTDAATEHQGDGLPPGEGAFLACSFWLADNYVLQGRRREAEALFTRLLALRNDLGLLAEEYHAGEQCLVGNFPQAFSHVALVGTALNLARVATPRAGVTQELAAVRAPALQRNATGVDPRG
jgi:GH15 family glucan-1,4-alpha-glucosidase